MTYTIAADRYTRPHSPATTAVGPSRRTAAVHPGWASLTPRSCGWPAWWPKD